MYHEDYWTAQQLEDGQAPHDAVFVPSQGVWRQPLDEEDDEEDIQREMMEEAGRRRPDSIDWMRDGDTRHVYDDEQ